MSGAERPFDFSLKKVAQVFTAQLTEAVTAPIKLVDTFNGHAERMFDNGLRVRFSADPDERAFRLAAVVNAGASSDPAHRTGVAHFLEHMIFYQNDEAWKFFNRELPKKGGRFEAWTSGDSTMYEFTIPAGKGNEKFLCENVARFLLHPQFDPEQVSLEKNVILNERMRAKRNEQKLHLTVFEAAFSKPQGSSDPLGKTDDISSMTVDDLKAFHRKHYVPGNIRLGVSGPEAFSRVYGTLAKELGRLPDAPVPENTSPEASYTGGCQLKPDDGASNTKVGMGFNFPPRSDPRSNVKQDVLESYIRLALMDQLRGRDRRELYSFEVFSSADRANSPVLYMGTIVEPPKAALVMQVMTQVMTDIAAGRIDQDLFEIAKAEMSRRQDDYRSMSDKNENSYYGRVSAFIDYHRTKWHLGKIWPADLSEIVNRDMLSKPPTVVATGNLAHMPSYEEVKTWLANDDDKVTPRPSERASKPVIA